MAEQAAIPNGAASARTEDGRRRRTIATPEGVPLSIDLADRGTRAAAVLIDLLAIVLILIGILVGAVTLANFLGTGRAWVLAFVFLASFFVRSFYFALFELRWQGATPGKRLFKIRVIDRAGGPLRADAILARNLMREVELFLPISLLLASKITAMQSGPWTAILSLIWGGIFLLMPLFNRDSLRTGDMVAGTWVVEAPKPVLLPDLVEERSDRGAPTAEEDFRFTPAQLDVYGIYELQTLEEILRRTDADAARVRVEVSSRIRKKIDWKRRGTELPPDPKLFLDAFYKALRAHLERRMLFGVRRRDKHDKS